MKTELVRFKTSDGLTLEGLLFLPNKKTNKIIVHVHGSAGNFYENVFIDNFSKVYTDNGYALLTFINRGAEYQREMS